jgi:hypothetical protein
VVEEITATSAATIASVRTDLGPVVIAALATPRLEPGTQVSLASQPGGGVGYVPAPDHQEPR